MTAQKLYDTLPDGTTEDEFIGKYLDIKMKNHKLPLGLEYYHLIDKHTNKAERVFESGMQKILNFN